MAEELFVDVQYRGLEFGRRVRIEDFAAPQAYLHHPLPMPVGTELLVDVGDGLEIPVQVARVNEQVSGNDKPPGMFVSPGSLDARAQRWWDERVANSEDPVTILKTIAEPVTSQAFADTIQGMPAQPIVDTIQGMPAQPIVDMQAVQPDQDASDTQVMDAVTQQDIVEAQARHEAVSEPSNASEQANGETAEVAAKGKKKRRRKKRPTRG
jgi:hypothetical protein